MDGSWRGFADDTVAHRAGPLTPQPLVEIGHVIEVAGGTARIVLDGPSIQHLHDTGSLALAGEVGSQVKMRSGNFWLVANIRSLKLDIAGSDLIVAEIDFLGEGSDNPDTGDMTGFRRGVTRYPMPGCRIYPASQSDLRQIFAAEDRPHIELGTVYPTADVRGALYVDSLLGRHFALVGSTGTGKSTSLALILHRICELAPQGHVV